MVIKYLISLVTTLMPVTLLFFEIKIRSMSWYGTI